MDFIVFDLEFNQYTASGSPSGEMRNARPFEIIQIGAVKLNERLDTVGKFSRFVKPFVYPAIDPFITELTGISQEDVENAESFPTVLAEFLEFAGGNDPVLCGWGMSDMKELFRSARRHESEQNTIQLNRIQLDRIPRSFINIQLYAARHFGLSKKKTPSLRSAVEALAIPAARKFHDALNDAVYTSEVFRKIYNASIQPEKYDPSGVRVRLKQTKNSIDFDGLLGQFEKMYARPLTDEEKRMIVLAYKMGRTRQFVRTNGPSDIESRE
jgi:DNA polymerase III epsilon subunit-like protein